MGNIYSGLCMAFVVARHAQLTALNSRMILLSGGTCLLARGPHYRIAFERTTPPAAVAFVGVAASTGACRLNTAFLQLVFHGGMFSSSVAKRNVG